MASSNMAATTVELGSLKFTSRASRHMGLETSTTISLALPTPAHLPSASAQELSQLVADGQLWIARASPCRLEISAKIDGDPIWFGDPSACNPEETILEYLCACPIWDQLGLKIVRDTTGDLPGSQTAPQAIFSIKHPPSASGLIAPDSIPCAQFRSMSCQFLFQGSIFEDGELKSPAASLVHGALSCVVGANKRVQGVREVEGRTTPSLVEIAPAVWNFHYLQDIAARSRFLPLVAGFLTDLAHTAQSPGLRQKSIAAQQPREIVDLAGPFYDSEPGYPNLEGRLWTVLLKGLPHLQKTRKPKAGASTPNTPLESTQNAGNMPRADDGNGHGGQSGDDDDWMEAGEDHDDWGPGGPVEGFGLDDGPPFPVYQGETSSSPAPPQLEQFSSGFPEFELEDQPIYSDVMDVDGVEEWGEWDGGSQHAGNEILQALDEWGAYYT